MDKNEIEQLAEEFIPLIKEMIDSNRKFYGFNEPIRYGFHYDDNACIMGVCDRKNNAIVLNVNSLLKAKELQDYLDVEYFVIHEIRHIFQHLIIADYLENRPIEILESIVEKWIEEFNNYKSVLLDTGEENPLYFHQDCELDAYSFSYAVMLYKYGKAKTSNLYIYDGYGNEFWSIVNEWLDYFNKNDL